MAERDGENNTNESQVSKGIKRVLSHNSKVIIRAIAIFLVAVIAFGGISYVLKLIDGKEDKNNPKNAPAAVKKYAEEASIDKDGKISFDKTPRELWEELKENNNAITKYLNSAEELAKIMYVQLVTEYPYTGEYLDTKTGEIPEKDKASTKMFAENVDSKVIQGITKIKRSLQNGEEIYMQYMSPEKLNELVEKYKRTKSEEDRDEALKYFTIEGKNTKKSVSYVNSPYSHWPTPSCTIISQRFHLGHGAIDIGAAMGDNVEAVEAGKVINAVTGKVRLYKNPGTLETNGNYVAIDHGNGKITLYNHLQDVVVTVGETVEKGQLIGHVGNTGYTVGLTGEHLHFAVFNGSGTINYNDFSVRDDPLGYKYDNGMGSGENGIGSAYGDGASSSESSNSDNYSGDDTSDQSGLVIKVARFSEVRSIRETSDIADPDVKGYDTNTCSMSLQEIDYKSYLSKYTMPFNYLWAMLIIGQDKEFAFDLADLVYDSKFEITIRDNVKITTKTETNLYQKKTEYNVTNIRLSASYDEVTSVDSSSKGNNPTVIKRNIVLGPYQDKGEIYEPSESNKYKVIDTTINTDDTLNIGLTLADTWFVKYEEKFKYSKIAKEKTNASQANLEDQGLNSGTSPNDPFGIANRKRIEMENSYKEKYRNVRVTLNGSQTQYKIYRINRTVINEETQEGNEYINSPAETTEKTDKNATEPNFVTVFVNNYNARSNILSVESWLFKILESNEDTKNMVDLTKYLLSRATGTNYGVTTFDFSLYDPSEFKTPKSVGSNLPLTKPTLSKENFVKSLQEYSVKISGDRKNQFDKNFLPNAELIYNISVSKNVNPELVVITACAEGGYKESGGRYNYWGIGVPNGASSGGSYNSLEEGIGAYAKVIASYCEGGSYAREIENRYSKRKAAGCDPLGYGKPGTFSGMQSIYSWLGKHEYGSSGAGGYYYMDPERANVTKIYKTHQEFLDKCYNAGGEHEKGKVVTEWEAGQYTAWQVETKLNIWNEIFGKYGDINT